MDNETEYLLEEIKLLSASDLSHRNRIDTMIVFYLTGLSALVSASIVACASINSQNLLGVAIGFAALGEFALGAFTFIRVIHLRYRRLENKAYFFYLRRLLFEQGLKSALHLSMDRPKSDLHFTGRNGLIFLTINITSSIGLGIAIAAFIWSGTQVFSLFVTTISILAFIISATIFAVIQHKYAEMAEHSIKKKEIFDERD